jgi:hypothetical protein
MGMIKCRFKRLEENFPVFGRVVPNGTIWDFPGNNGIIGG